MLFFVAWEILYVSTDERLQLAARWQHVLLIPLHSLSPIRKIKCVFLWLSRCRTHVSHRRVTRPQPLPLYEFQSARTRAGT